MASKAETIMEDTEPTAGFSNSSSDLSAADSSSTMGADQLSEDSLPTTAATSADVFAASATTADCNSSATTRSDSQQSDSLNMDMEDPNDSGIEANLSQCNIASNNNGYNNSNQSIQASAAFGGFSAAGSRLERGDSANSDVFDSAADFSFSQSTKSSSAQPLVPTPSSSQANTSSNASALNNKPTTAAGINSRSSGQRVRSISTSLAQHPIVDSDLQDFHEHNLEAGYHPLNIK